MKNVKVYPPGGGIPVTPHPSRLDEMLSKGWTLKNQKKAASKSNKTEES